MTRSAMILQKHTTESPLEFWTKATKTGKTRAYYFGGSTGKTAISLAEVERAEAQGTAVRVAEPDF